MYQFHIKLFLFCFIFHDTFKPLFTLIFVAFFLEHITFSVFLVMIESHYAYYTHLRNCS